MLSLHFPGKFAVKAALALTLVAAQLSLHAQHIPLDTPIPSDPSNTPPLTVADVNQILTQGVGYMKAVGVSGIIAVCDREGHMLAVYRMNTSVSVDPRINEQATVKARTASFFESRDNAFTSRTAQFIVQSNFPPKIRNVDAGPLFGVPFSNFPNGDVQLNTPDFIAFINGVNAPPSFPAGTANFRPILQPLVITPLTDDPGGLTVFKVGSGGTRKFPAGGVGVEIDGFGVLANGVPDKGVGRTDTGIVPGPSKQLIEEAAALAAIGGFEPPPVVVATKIVVNGFRFPYVSAHKKKTTPIAVGALATEGVFQDFTDTDGTERSPSGAPLAVNAYATDFRLKPKVIVPAAAQPRATPMQEIPLRGYVPRFPPRDSPLGAITQADVVTMVQQAADEAIIARAAIRNPKDRPVAVWITVVDLNGDICGLFRTEDATYFSFDLCVQKARTAAFFSTDKVGFTSRAIGFMSQTFYPPGVSAHPPGPISGLLEQAGGDAGNLGETPLGTQAANLTEISQLLSDRTISFGYPNVQTAVQTLARRLVHIRDGRISPLQVSIYVDLTLRTAYSPPQVPNNGPVRDGLCIFPGGVPIYKNGVLVGGLGVSGDGVDQDDLIAFNGQRGFYPPDGVRCDQADEVGVKAALLASIPKLKAQFPTLTNGMVPGPSTSPSVIDVVEHRLNVGPILGGLRLPYVKLPRAPLISNN